MSPEMGRYTLEDDNAIMAAHIADLDAHTKNWLELMRTGEYIIPPLQDYANVAMVANTLYAIPFFVARAITVDRIALRVHTLADPSNIRLGIYNDGTNCYPGTLVKDCGTVSGATTEVKAITIDPAQSLTKGLYWLALVGDATPQLYRLRRLVWCPTGVAADDLLTYRAWKVSFTYAALPDPFTAAGSLDEATSWVMGLRVASLT